jgi:hypothetical protein
VVPKDWLADVLALAESSTKRIHELLAPATHHRSSFSDFRLARMRQGR